MTALYAPVIPERRPKRVPRKCSTCADGSCRARGSVCDWLDCWKWTPGNNKNGGNANETADNRFPAGQL